MVAARMQEMQRNEAAPAQGSSNEWTNGLFECCNSGVGTCLYAFCCTTCARATTRTNLDSSDWCFNFCCLTQVLGYNIIREGYGIEGNCCGDILKTLLCPGCTTAQMLQEVKARGGYQYENRGADAEEDWKYHTFSCFDKFEAAIYTFCCPYCALADARSSYDGSDCIFNFFCVPTAIARNIIREGYKIKGGCMEDICCSVLCPFCTICQLVNEVAERGPINRAKMDISLAPMPGQVVVQQPLDQGGV